MSFFAREGRRLVVKAIQRVFSFSGVVKLDVGHDLVRRLHFLGHAIGPVWTRRVSLLNLGHQFILSRCMLTGVEGVVNVAVYSCRRFIHNVRHAEMSRGLCLISTTLNVLTGVPRISG